MAHLGNVKVESFTGLVTAAATGFAVDCLIKGIRGSADLGAELQQAHMNFTTGAVPTVLIPASGPSALVASRYVREIARMGGAIEDVVPPAVASALSRKLAS